MTDLERKAVQRVFELLEIAQGDLRDATEILRQALAQPEQEPVAHLWECIGRWTAMVAHDGEDANLAPPDWLIDAVKAATAPPKQPEQEPVGYVTDSGTSAYFLKGVDLDDDTPLYTAPPKREWVGLTDADKQEACIHMQKAKGGFANIKSLEFIERCWEFADYLDAKLKEKNT